VNLPNAITVGRIVLAPFVAWLPFASTWQLRLVAFVLFVVVAVSDYYDGMLARTRNLVTNLGKQLDPLADKLFLVATFVPMYVLMEHRALRLTGGAALSDAEVVELTHAGAFPFTTPVGTIGFPLWIALVILGREIAMTVFRQLAARRSRRGAASSSPPSVRQSGRRGSSSCGSARRTSGSGRQRPRTSSGGGDGRHGGRSPPSTASPAP
jgi:CDP-diacylglycerol---glycerol-3-phosphate 3-phosphatidyltransferase